MIDFLTRIDTELFLFLNGLHISWLDPVMTFISGEITWAPFYIVLLYLVIKKYNEVIKDLVYLPNGHCGGAYGFISSHACNTFALAAYLTLLLRKHYAKIAWVMFTWATLVAYSRIYMGVHYPGDVIVGAAVGAIIGFVIGTLANKVIKTSK